jgi:hypothetical protein
MPRAWQGGTCLKPAHSCPNPAPHLLPPRVIPADDLEAAVELAPAHPNAAGYLEAVRAKAQARGVRLLPPAAHRAAKEEGQQGQQNGGAAPEPCRQSTQQQQQQQQQQQGEGQAGASGGGARGREAARVADGKRRRGGSRSRSSSRSSRSRSRSRGAGGSSATSSDSAAAAAARLARASGAAADGGGMDAATALDIVARHYRSRQGPKRSFPGFPNKVLASRAHDSLDGEAALGQRIQRQLSFPNPHGLAGRTGRRTGTSARRGEKATSTSTRRGTKRRSGGGEPACGGHAAPPRQSIAQLLPWRVRPFSS